MEFTNLVELLPMLAGLCVAAVFAGILAGLLGVGGGIIIVPALFWLFSIINFDPALAMHTAVGTSLATIIATSISSMRAHDKKGAVDWELFKRWLTTLGFGALAGGIAAKFISSQILTLVFAVLALLIAINLFLPKGKVIAEELPSKAKQGGISGLIGFVSALMGIGGGTFSVPTMVAYSYPTHRAVGTASALGLIIAIPATIGFIISGWGVQGLLPVSLGYVNIIAALVILPFTIIFAPVGAKLAHALPEKMIKKAFAVFLFATSIKMFLSLA